MKSDELLGDEKMSIPQKTQLTITRGLAFVALVLATGNTVHSQTPSRVDPLRSVATALVKPNALLVLDLSASMQCDLQAINWPVNSELAFGSTDKRTCVDQSGLPTGVRTGDFLAPDGSVLANPILPDDFFSAKWALEFSGSVKKSKGGDACLMAPA